MQLDAYGPSHRELLRTWWDALRTSFWFVPAIMAGIAAGMAATAPSVDGWLDARPDRNVPWFVYVSAPGDARQLLSTLLASMMTMTSLVFSITMVVLTLAANQFGPRLIRSFMATPQTQLVLGTFVMTIVYSLLALSSVGWRTGAGPFAYMSVTVAIGLALISVGFLVLYIHELGRSIMSETLIERVGGELDTVMRGLGPLEAGQLDPEEELPHDFDSRAELLGPPRAGYVQAIEFGKLVEAGRRADVLIGLYFKPGDFVTEGGKSIAIYPGERCTPELAETVRDGVVIGIHRTPVQDVEFAIRHLVEIAVRALSPGINDPYTAISVINRLSASLSRLLQRRLPRAVFADEEGGVRVVCPRPTYASMIGAAFDQIRQNGADKPIVLIHLLEAIGRIAPHAQTGEQHEALLKNIHILLATAERRIDDENDLDTIRRRARDAQKELES